MSIKGTHAYRKAEHPARVNWDAEDGSWRIYVWDHHEVPGDAQSEVAWWPIRWLRFASREAAEAHLAGHPETA